MKIQARLVALLGRIRKGAREEAGTHIDPSPTIEELRTRLWLKVISQEPLEIEFQRIDVSNRVVQKFPIHQVESPGKGKTSGRKVVFPVLHLPYISIGTSRLGWGLKLPGGQQTDL